MKILALDTSTERAAVAVRTAVGAVFAATPDPSQRHGRNLGPAIRDLLREASLDLRELDAIAIGLGPGSYTGLRIGLTAAKTLAYAASRPLVGLDSLELIARNAPADAQRVSAIADAQRGDLYVADFVRTEPGGRLVRAGSTRIEPFDHWSARLESPTLVLGPGLARLRTPLPPSAVTAEPAANWPQPQALLELAGELVASGRRDDVWFLEPLYLRRSAAEDQWDAAKAR